MQPKILKHNLKILRRNMRILADILDRETPSESTYEVEEARNGMPTLRISHQGNSFQVHSRYDPQREADQQILGAKFRNPKLMIIFGLGLGYHIRAVIEKLGAENLFIIVIEPDLAAWKAAVQNVDLSDLFNSTKIRWVIGVPQDQGMAVLHEMIKQSGIALQLYLKTLVVFEHPVLTKIHGAYYTTMLKGFREAGHTMIFNYGNCPHDSLIGVENLMRNLKVVMRSPGIKDLFGAFAGVPGIIVATGPTLDRNIEELRPAMDRAVIVCADSALRVLHQHGMAPHLIASLERVHNTVKLLEGFPADYAKDVYLAACPVVQPRMYEVWNGPTIMVYRAFAHFDWIDMPRGTLPAGLSCSNLAFKILEAIGCNPIILVGQDCSFESATKTHAVGVHQATRLGLKEKDLFPIKGNYQETVLTNMIFEMFRKGFVNDVAQFRGTTINATAGGAYIEGTVLMPLHEAVAKYCPKPLDIRGIIRRHLSVPTPQQLSRDWRKFRTTMIETRKEVEGVIEFCARGIEMVQSFERELDEGGFFKLEDFLARFPDERLNEVYGELSNARGKIILFGKYFNLYLMHIVQMVIVKFEMDFNELPTLCDEPKRVKLQAIKMMRQWFPTIGDICRIALDTLNQTFDMLTKEFGNPDEDGANR